MKKALILTIIPITVLTLLFSSGCAKKAPVKSKPLSRSKSSKASSKTSLSKEAKKLLEGIEWLGHASFRIGNDKVIYIDPYQVNSQQPADIILITHSHYDHLSPDDVGKIQKENTIIITPADGASNLTGNVKTIKPGETLDVQGITVETVPAYNINKQFHPKDKGWVGFIITVEGKRIYHAGDTDVIPEMDKVEADVALLPVGGTYTMNASEAAQAVNKIKPKIAIPMHYGTVAGSEKDAEKFKKLASVEVEILQPESQ